MQQVKAYGRAPPSAAEMPARLRRGLIAAGFRAWRPGLPACEQMNVIRLAWEDAAA